MFVYGNGDIDFSTRIFLSKEIATIVGKLELPASGGGVAGVESGNKRGQHILVAIAHEKIRIQLSQIKRNVADSMCTIHAAQNTLLPALRHKFLEWESNARVTNDSIKKSHANIQAFTPQLFYYLAKAFHDLLVGGRERIWDLARLDRCGFHQPCDGLLTRSVYGIKVDDNVTWCILQVSKDDIHSRRSIFGENDLVHGSVEHLCQLLSGHIDVFRLQVTEEQVWFGLKLVLEFPGLIPDNRRESSI